MQNPKNTNVTDGPKKKAPVISHKGLIRLDFLAPRPGLEPGTYGLTAQVTPVLIAHKVKKFKEFSAGQGAEFSMPNYRPNLWRRWWQGWLEKLNRINELR
jgi:hypothetical protein